MVVEDSEAVAMVEKRGSSGSKKCVGGGGTKNAGRGNSNCEHRQQSGNATKALARKASGLCFFHWTFGDKAARCEGPCTWQGN